MGCPTCRGSWGGGLPGRRARSPFPGSLLQQQGPGCFGEEQGPCSMDERCQEVKVRCVRFGAWPPKAISSLHSAESEAHEGQVACPRPLLTLPAVAGQGSSWVGLSLCEYWPPRGSCRVPHGGAPSLQTGEIPGRPLVAEPSSFTLGAGPGWGHWVRLCLTAPTPCPASLGVGKSLQPGTGDAFPVTPHWEDSPTHC